MLHWKARGHTTRRERLRKSANRALLLAAVLLTGVLMLGGAYFTPIAQADPFVTVRVIIEHVKALAGCLDPPACNSADFFARVTIGGEQRENRDAFVQDQLEISPDWEFSSQVDLNRGSIPIQIEIGDRDDQTAGDPTTGDDRVDIDADDNDQDLLFSLGLRDCAIYEGDVIGTCGQALTSSGNESNPAANIDRGEIRFRVEVTLPPSAPGLNVRCIHDPIWPQAGQTVKITVEALDDTLAPKVADTIEIWVNDQSGPDQACSGATNCTWTSQPVIPGTFSYNCVVKSGGSAVGTLWRVVQIGSPDAGRAVPILFTGPRGSRIDIVFIPDRDSYSGPNDSTFRQDVASVITNAYYGEYIFLINQDALNFWIAMDTGDAENDCRHETPSNWNDDYTFADSGALVHTDDFRDCALPGERIFSSEPSSLRVFLHETGHAPFGLADEYCCDGGYWQPEIFPNLYTTNESCDADLPNLRANWSTYGVGGACRSFQETRGSRRTLWISDPAPGHLMDDNGRPRAEDARRIDWLFGQCRSALC